MRLTPEEWTKVKAVLSVALDRPSDERDTYLDEACGEDVELRRSVESLIAADERTWDLMDVPAASSISAGPPARLPQAGDRIGPYAILAEIGHGGMGVVYLARRADAQYEKKVAIKLARVGFAGDEMERRFRSERQIVAGLEHPNIARLFDGGTTPDGQAYLVMEYVEGEPLNQWCDAHKLSTRQRLEIFLEVCAAVAYAHQHLVVHRDLKPANIHVTAEGSVKLLDFGIAKLMGSELEGQSAEQTGTFFRAFTPDYASPEQIRGEPVSTASDVYALGVLLCELLTRARPYRIMGLSPGELVAAICEKEPAKPSSLVPPSLSRELSGDLDAVVAKALRKEPSRRYPSVGALADDLRRHLTGLPVEARVGAFGYRAGKFVRRHHAAVSGAALVVAALAAGLVLTLREARLARAAEARAEQRFQDVRKLANSFLFEIHDAIEPLPGSTPARELLVRRALEYLDRLSREKQSDPGLRRELAIAYYRVGDVLGRPGFPNLGDSQGAQASYRKALRIRQELAQADPRDRSLALELAQSYQSVGELEKALGIREGLAREFPGDEIVQRSLELSYFAIAVAHKDRKQYREAFAYRQKQMAVAEALWKSAPADQHRSRDLALAYKYVGGSYESLGRPGEGVEYYRKAAVLDEKRCAGEPAGSQARLDLSYDYGGIGECLAKLGDWNGGLQSYGRALALRQEVAEADPKNVDARSAVSRAERQVAWVLLKREDFVGALAGYAKALAIRQELARADPPSPDKAYDVAESLEDIAKVHVDAAKALRTSRADRRRHWAEAKAAYTRSRDVLLELQRKGQLRGIIDEDPERLAAEIARCEEALAPAESATASRR